VPTLVNNGENVDIKRLL